MERYTLAVVEFLRDHPEVCDVRFSRGAPLTEARLVEWERANAPYRLPGDLRAFLAQSDGFAVRWSVSAGAAGVADVGDMSIGGIDRLAPVPLDASPADDPWACSGVPGRPDGGRDIDEDGLDEDDDGVTARRRRPVAAFDLASSSRAFGRVALVYVIDETRDDASGVYGGACTTEVWFQDPAARWRVLAESFSAYFRALHANLGLPNWHARATDVGLDPDSRAWFRWMAPHTLALDLKRGEMRRTSAKRDARGASAKDAKPSPRGSRRFGAAAAAAVGADRDGRATEKPLCVDPRSARAS